LKKFGINRILGKYFMMIEVYNWPTIIQVSNTFGQSMPSIPKVMKFTAIIGLTKAILIFLCTVIYRMMQCTFFSSKHPTFNQMWIYLQVALPSTSRGERNVAFGSDFGRVWMLLNLFRLILITAANGREIVSWTPIRI
jgi:hypothetical protein